MFKWLHFKKKEKEPEYEYGKPKSVDNLCVDDLLKYPIWEYALDMEGEYDEESGEEIDETWVKPVLNSISVVKSLFEPYILLKDESGELSVMGMLHTKDLTVDDLWYKDLDTGETKRLPGSAYTDRTFVAVPEVCGKVGRTYRMDQSRGILVEVEE